MSHEQHNHEHTSSMSTKKRMMYGAILGIALFTAGGVIYKTGLFDRLFVAMGGMPENKRPALAQSAEQARADMMAARKLRTKDVNAPAPLVPVGPDGYYVPPAEADIPDSNLGKAIRRGRDIFINTGTYASQYVGNSMACVNCHVDNGRRENSAPMWAAYGMYPAYRPKTNSINTLEDRIQGCFMYSMNAQASPAKIPPPHGDDIYRDLITYFHWMADGAPTGEKMPGAMYISLKKTEQGYDWKRGEKVYQQNCALCHGDNGEGTREANGKIKFPPLWGPEAYNWGAGMMRVNTAAGFIKANMPLGKPYSLSDQEAWDVAAFINSHERPKDPRQTGTVEEARLEFHEDEQSYYGKEVNGKILGHGVTR